MNQIPLSLILCAGLSLGLVACRKKDPGTELQKAADAIAAPEAAPAPATQPVQAQTPGQQPSPEAPAAAPPAPSQQMQQAMASYKAGNLEDAVTRLQKLRATPALSPQQRMALQDAVAAVMGEVYSMAAKGDSRAIAAVKQYEQMQTMPR